MLTYREMRDKNGLGFSRVQYLSGILHTFDGNDDIAMSFISLFFPEFINIYGYPINCEIGAGEKFKKNIQEGQSLSEACYWSNMIEINENFSVEGESARKFAICLAASWNNILSNINFHEFRAVELEDLDGEFCVTVRMGNLF